MITRLRKAIDRGELVLHYQPTVDLHTGEIKGVEALARWDDDELGTVSPAEFISVAEETGLIVPLGAWVMDEVARQARVWDREGLDFEIAFNLSPRQLWHVEGYHVDAGPRFAERRSVLRHAAESEADAGYVPGELEGRRARGELLLH